MELIIKKCLKCGATVEVLKDCMCDNCGIRCCNEPMVELEPNIGEEVDSHLPSYEIKNNEIIVKLDHALEDNHHIEWILLITKNEMYKKCLTSSTVNFPYVRESKLYVYCNKHGLYSVDIM